jgi:hypothetical protein
VVPKLTLERLFAFVVVGAGDDNFSGLQRRASDGGNFVH